MHFTGAIVKFDLIIAGRVLGLLAVTCGIANLKVMPPEIGLPPVKLHKLPSNSPLKTQGSKKIHILNQRAQTLQAQIPTMFSGGQRIPTTFELKLQCKAAQMTGQEPPRANLLGEPNGKVSYSL